MIVIEITEYTEDDNLTSARLIDFLELSNYAKLDRSDLPEGVHLRYWILPPSTLKTITQKAMWAENMVKEALAKHLHAAVREL